MMVHVDHDALVQNQPGRVDVDPLPIPIETVRSPLHDGPASRRGADGRGEPHAPLPIDREWMEDAVLLAFRWEGLGVQELTLAF